MTDLWQLHVEIFNLGSLRVSHGLPAQVRSAYRATNDSSVGGVVIPHVVGKETFALWNVLFVQNAGWPVLSHTIESLRK